MENILKERSGNKCELCGSDQGLKVYEVPPVEESLAEKSVLLCEKCFSYKDDPSSVDSNHWRCLSESMWSEHTAVQVLCWRILNSLESEGWAADLLSQMYLEDENLAWAKALDENSSGSLPTKDSNGTTLNDGDSVTLIKDLVVKGANFTAKRGTMVKNISLTDDPKHIEGRVNGTRIVLVAAFLKKA